jgi:hypothetical protein
MLGRQERAINEYDEAIRRDPSGRKLTPTEDWSIPFLAMAI